MLLPNVLLFGTLSSFSRAFQHPGVLNIPSQLDLVNSSIHSNSYPWYGSYLMFQRDPRAQATYTASPVVNISTNDQTIRQDGKAAWYNALMFWFTGDTAYEQNAIEIVLDWASTLKYFADSTGNINVYTSVKHFISAAEIVRYSGTGLWSAENTTTMNDWLTNVMLPQAADHNGTWDGNQGIGDLYGMFAISIFTENQTLYDAALQTFETGACINATYYIDTNGCPGEAGRDQAHAQDGLSNYALMAKMAESQSDTSLWTLGSDRIFSGWNWTSAENYGYVVPYSNTGTCYMSYGSLSTTDRGQWLYGYEMVYWWYKTNLNLVSTFTEQVLSRIRPEPGRTQGGSLSGNDDPYYGTLLWTTSSSESTSPIYPEGYYTITAYTGSHYVTTPSNSVSTNTELILSTNPTEWYFLPLGNEYYQFLPASASSTEVVFTGSATYSPVTGSNVTLHTYNSQESETWKIANVSEPGYVMLTARDSITQQMPVTEYNWGVRNGSQSAGASLSLVESDASDVNQWFVITAVGIA